MNSFERMLKNEIEKFRKMFGEHDASYLTISIEASGPVDHGDMKITFRIGEDSYGDGSVKGGNLDQCATEYFRRKGWSRANDYIALPYFDANTIDDND